MAASWPAGKSDDRRAPTLPPSLPGLAATRKRCLLDQTLCPHGKPDKSSSKTLYGRLRRFFRPYRMARDACRLMAWAVAANLCYDLADGANDQFLRNSAVVGIRRNDLASAGGKPREFWLNFMDPHLLVCSSLPI